MMTLRIIASFICLLLISSSVDAELSKKEKLAATAVLAIAKNKTSSKENKKNISPRLATIKISGVDSELKKNIELHMPVTIPECAADRAEIKQFFTTVKKHLRKASRALGYYDSEFRSGGKIVSGCWKLRLRITPGRPVKVFTQNFQVTGEGKTSPRFLKILEELPYETGDDLNHQKYTDYKTSLSETALTLGYFDAEFTKHTIKVNPLSLRADITLIMNTGKRYRYGKINIDQEVLSDKSIRNLLIMKEGAVYKTEDLIDQQQLLQRSGYFKLIKIDVLHDQAQNNRVPIKISLKRNKRNAYKFKLGYGSDTGGRISAEMDRRWTSNKGKQLKVKAQYAENLSGISFKLLDPRKNPEDNNLVYNLSWGHEINKDISSQSINIGSIYTKKRKNDWTQTASVDLLLERSQVRDEKSIKTKLLLFGVGLEKTKADNLIFPNDGWRLKLSLKGALQNVLSDKNVTQAEILGKAIKTVGTGRFIARVHVGASIIDSFEKLPNSLRFFAGGGNSVRGYTANSLGKVRDGKVVGGKNLLNLSLEYQYPITDEWSAAAFVDAGNAFNNWDNYELKVGVGFGARYKSPIGPVRIDIGFPDDDFHDPHLHLSIGSDL